MARHILVIEDEKPIRELLSLNLQKAGYGVKLCEDTEDGVFYLADKTPDLIILDWMMPGMNGLEFLSDLRKDGRTKDIPVIMLSARVSEFERIEGLDAGADDYLCKPFSPKELLARTKALLRRSEVREVNKDQLAVGEVLLDLSARQAFVKDKETHLGPTEFRLLEHFMRSPGKIYSRAQLLDSLWGLTAEVDERTVDVHIRRLRKSLAIEGNDNIIRTIRGVGYGMKK